MSRGITRYQTVEGFLFYLPLPSKETIEIGDIVHGLPCPAGIDGSMHTTSTSYRIVRDLDDIGFKTAWENSDREVVEDPKRWGYSLFSKEGERKISLEGGGPVSFYRFNPNNGYVALVAASHSFANRLKQLHGAWWDQVISRAAQK